MINLQLKFKYLFGIILLILSITPSVWIVSCEKGKFTREPKVETGQVSEILTTSAKVSGEIIDIGEGLVEHGHCWSTNSYPTIADYKTEMGTVRETGTYTSELLNLEAGIKYFDRAYCQTRTDVVYGKDQIFTTLDGKSQMTTTEVTEITAQTAQSGGNIMSVNGDKVLGRGICWDTTNNFTLSICIGFTKDSLGLGNFASELTGLIPGMTYKVKAYSTSGIDTSYGNVVTFTTLSGITSITTSKISNITSNSATSGGIITSAEGTIVIARGICWNLEDGPTLKDNVGFTIDDSGLGEFSSLLIGLEPRTTYNVRAYAITTVDTTYGYQETFTTSRSTITSELLNVNWFSIVISSTITNDDVSMLYWKGACWSTLPNPTLADEQISNGNGAGSGTYTSELLGLLPNTTYYIKAYVSYLNGGREYGPELIITTNDFEFSKPFVATGTHSFLSNSSADVHGIINSLGDTTVQEYGHCWSTSLDPTISDNRTQLGSSNSTGTYFSVLTKLSDDTEYYVRAYAINDQGISYGENVSISFNPACPACSDKTIFNIPKAFISNCLDNIYQSNANCTWTIYPTSTSEIYLQFVQESFDIKPGDWVKVYNGSDANSELIGTYDNNNGSSG